MSILSPFLHELDQNLCENESPEAAWKVIQEYLHFFGSDGVKKDLLEMTMGSLTNKKLHRHRKADSRGNTVFFYEYTVLFVKAVDVLLKQKQQQQAAGSVQ